MKTNPSITIVIPVFNEANHLKRCLSAIATQTILPTEIIIVDNNCTDNSVAVARSFSGVRVVREHKQGIVYARNSGFDAVTSDIIARIDADTVLPKDWIASVLAFYALAANTNNALTGGGYFYNVRMSRFNGWLQGQIAFRMNRLIIGHYILWGSNMAMTREQWHKVRQQVCDRDDLHEDIDLAIHLQRAGYKITYHESLRVGVKLKRVWEQRWEQRKHLARWPRTLRVHGYSRWWFGSIGNVLLAVVGEPYIVVSEAIARLFRRSRLPQ